MPHWLIEDCLGFFLIGLFLFCGEIDAIHNLVGFLLLLNRGFTLELAILVDL